MVYRLDDWVLDIDVDNTRNYTEHLLSDHCECGYCRNFYKSVETVYPQFRDFLKQFGADAEAPVDFLPVEPTLCIVSYAVKGRIITSGQRPIQAGNCLFTPEGMENLDYELKCPKPYFVFTSQYLQLPWLLDEDPNEVISPANEPECLERMWKKLLINAPDSSYKS